MKSLILLYNALFLSHLNYCSNIWGNTFKFSLKNIFILQKRAIKCICNTHSMYTNFYTISNSLKFDDIVKMNSIKFMFRARNNIYLRIYNYYIKLNLIMEICFIE